MKTIVYHNPRCSKSRETVKLLTSHRVDFDVRLYLEDIPSAEEISTLLQKLGFSSARELMRTKETLYKELNLAEEMDEKQLIVALHNHPKLIERPIVMTNKCAKIGRPPESVLALFE